MAKIEHIALIIYVTASTAGVLIIKNFLNTIHYENIYEFIHQLFNLQLILGVFLYVFGFLTWLYALSRMNLNVAYPVVITLSFLTIFISSNLILKENFTLNIAIRSLLCLIGVLFILK